MEKSPQRTGPRETFAERFALLYVEAGDPPLKRVTESVLRAREVDERGRPIRVPAQRISDWRRGRNVPARFAGLQKVLEILIGQARKARSQPISEGLYDLKAWENLWREALASPATTTNSDDEMGPAQPANAVCPYRGLAAFRREDAEWFFGRTRSTDDLVAHIVRATELGGFVVLVGASGAGKSSLLNAGLLAALRREPATKAEPPILEMTPGADPLGELARTLSDMRDDVREPDATSRNQGLPELANAIETEFDRYRGHGTAGRDECAGGQAVVVVDQFEELFTLCEDEAHRSWFIHCLHTISMPLSTGEPAACLVVLGIRADFYDRCLGYPELVEAMQNRQMPLGAMSVGELKEAVTRPAQTVGLQLESGLVDLMLRDLGVSGGKQSSECRAYDAGALPLLSHALMATWQRRQNGKLTITGYRAAGGIHGAVAATAERSWGNLDPAGRTAARRILLGLVHIGQDTRDTRRRSTQTELLEHAGNRLAGAQALEALTNARLVTVDADAVEITHEALLQAWPRLKEWIDEDRVSKLGRQRLEDDATLWANNDRDPSLLYRRARLETAKNALRKTNSAGPTKLARAFLHASAKQRKRAAWRTRGGVAVVCVFAVIALAATLLATAQQDDSRFDRILAEADHVKDTDPSLAAQLDLVANGLHDGDQSVRTRLLSTQNSPLATSLPGHNAAVYLTSYSPDGRTLATASEDKTVRLWDVADPTNPKPLGEPLTEHKDWVGSALFSQDGRTLVTAGGDQTARLWNVADPTNPKPLGEPIGGENGPIYLVAFSPDGRTLATANDDHTVRLWDVTNPERPAPKGQPLRGHAGPVRAVAFSPDGRTLATGGNDTTVRLWDVHDPEHPTQRGAPLQGNAETVHSVAFSQDGQTLATGNEDATVRLWDVHNPEHPTQRGPPLKGHDRVVWSVTFGPDGHTLASASADGTIRLWNLVNATQPEPLGGPLLGPAGTTYSVAFSPDGRTLASGSADGSARLWSLPAGQLAGHSTSVSSVAFSKGGSLLATGSGDRTVRLWQTEDPWHPVPVGPALRDADAPVSNVAFQTGGSTLAVANERDESQLWDVRSPRNPQPLGAKLPGTAQAFSQDGRVLAVTNGRTIQLWDVADPVKPELLSAQDTDQDSYLTDVSFSQDGRAMATADFAGSVRLWDVVDPTHPRHLGTRLTSAQGPVSSVRFSPDGSRLATGNVDRTVRLWRIDDIAHPKPAGRPLLGHSDAVSEIAFSPDGRQLASTSYDKTVRLWDLTDDASADPKQSQQLTGHTGVVLAVRFSLDGRFLATGSGDSTTRLWSLDVDRSIRRICSTTHGVLTKEQWSQHVPDLPYDAPCD